MDLVLIVAGVDLAPLTGGDGTVPAGTVDGEDGVAGTGPDSVTPPGCCGTACGTGVVLVAAGDVGRAAGVSVCGTGEPDLTADDGWSETGTAFTPLAAGFGAGFTSGCGVAFSTVVFSADGFSGAGLSAAVFAGAGFSVADFSAAGFSDAPAVPLVPG